MTTSTDIANRALQLIGTRTTIASLAEQSNEAIQANLVYNVVTDWCISMTNWNFARKTVIPTTAKTVTPVGAWTTTSPAPPWKYSFTLPTDFIRALFVTNSTIDVTSTFYLGEPKRFAIATDTITAVQQEVLLTNEAAPILTYVSRVTDPTLWPSFFERFTVATLAKTLSFALTGDRELTANLEKISLDHFSAAMSINRAEGLVYDDTSVEWIQAVGIPYPFNRENVTQRLIPQKQEPSRGDNQR